MNVFTLHPLAELIRCIRGRRRELTTSRIHIDEELCLDAYEQIGGEAIDRSRDIEATAHKAECYDIEALRRIKDAQAPDSEGGSSITTNEARTFVSFVAKSAELDHNIGGKARVEPV